MGCRRAGQGPAHSLRRISSCCGVMGRGGCREGLERRPAGGLGAGMGWGALVWWGAQEEGSSVMLWRQCRAMTMLGKFWQLAITVGVAACVSGIGACDKRVCGAGERGFSPSSPAPPPAGGSLGSPLGPASCDGRFDLPACIVPGQARRAVSVRRRGWERRACTQAWECVQGTWPAMYCL